MSNADAQPDRAAEQAHAEDKLDSSSRTSLTAPTEDSHEAQRANDVIVHRYLEWDTSFHEADVPLSRTEYAGSRARPPPPPPPPQPPDMTKYTNPMSWSPARKRFITWLSCLTTVFTAYTPGAYSAALASYEAEWGVSRVAALTGVTVFTAFFGIAPMFLAPFSELAGRRPVFVPAGIVYVVSQVAAAVTQSFGGMITSRVLAGISSSVFSTMVSGVLADIYRKEDRNTSMALFAGATMFGTGLGPLISGITVQHLSWRWIWYEQIIICGVVLLAMIVFFKETRGSILLSRKATALNKWYDALEEHTPGHIHQTVVEGEKAERIRWKVQADEERATIFQMVKISLVRPFHFLVTESVVFWFSMWISFAWGVLYAGFRAIPIWGSMSKGFNDEQNGAIFASICIASMISVVLAIWQGRYAAKSSRFPKTPEGRLYFTCVQATLLPIGLFWLGWTSYSSIPWIVPTLAIAVLTMGIYSIYLAVFNYFADVYHIYASSVNASQSFARNIIGGAIPLVVDPMFRNLTFQGGCSLLGGIAAVLTLVPWVLVIYGERIRARSKVAKSLE